MKIWVTFLLFLIHVLMSACGGGSSTSPQPRSICESKIPPEQPPSVRNEINPYPTPPTGYGAVIGWVNATIGSGGTTGKVTVNNLELWEDYNSTKTLLANAIICPSCTNPDDKVWGYTVEKSQWGNRSAWSKPNEGTKFQVQDCAVIAPVGNQPNQVYHFWHTYWPRPETKNGAKYYLTSDVVVEGDAMVQIGIDFWQSTNSGNNIEAAVSNWYCAASGVQSVKAGAYK